MYKKSLYFFTFASMKAVFVDWGRIPYAEAWERQTEWFHALVEAKAQQEACDNRIILCEHPHVYTLGRSGKENNMLLNEAQLKAIDATLYHIDRGGDITYHGPGTCSKKLLSVFVPFMAFKPGDWIRPPESGWKEIRPVPVRFVRLGLEAVIL